MKPRTHFRFMLASRVVIATDILILGICLGYQFSDLRWVMVVVVPFGIFWADRGIRLLFEDVITPPCPGCENGQLNYQLRKKRDAKPYVRYKCSFCGHKVKLERRL